MDKGKVIGRLTNNWRQRQVTVYETADPAKVVTVGVPFDGKSKVVECVESRSDWTRVIACYPEVAVYN